MSYISMLLDNIEKELTDNWTELSVVDVSQAWRMAGQPDFDEIAFGIHARLLTANNVLNHCITFGANVMAAATGFDQSENSPIVNDAFIRVCVPDAGEVTTWYIGSDVVTTRTTTDPVGLVQKVDVSPLGPYVAQIPGWVQTLWSELSAIDVCSIAQVETGVLSSTAEQLTCELFDGPDADEGNNFYTGLSLHLFDVLSLTDPVNYATALKLVFTYPTGRDATGVATAVTAALL